MITEGPQRPVVDGEKQGFYQKRRTQKDGDNQLFLDRRLISMLTQLQLLSLR